MKAVAAVLIALILGAVLGLGSAWVAADRFALSGEITVNGWRGNLYTGSTAADPYTRAAIAKNALLALARSETIYFFRSTDDAGQRFDARCTYRLDGGPQPARWWSVTLYDETLFLARNADNAPSVDATRTVTFGDGKYSVLIGPSRDGAPNWLSTNAAGAFALTIRLYNPDAAIQADPALAPLPSVTRVSCPGGVA